MLTLSPPPWRTWRGRWNYATAPYWQRRVYSLMRAAGYEPHCCLEAIYYAMEHGGSLAAFNEFDFEEGLRAECQEHISWPEGGDQ